MHSSLALKSMKVLGRTRLDIDKISRDGSVRAVVLASAFEKVFTAGLDLLDTGSLANIEGLDPARMSLKLRDHILHFQSCISAIERCTQPVVAAVHGVAFGLAIDILCCCDVRLSSPTVKYSIKEVDVGLAADIGTLARLPKITGNESLLRELAFTAREFGAEEAGEHLRWPKSSRPKVRLRLLDQGVLLHARDHSVDENLEYTATWNQGMLQSSDTTDAFRAFQTKKPAQFKPLPKL
ncbi:enoyl-CoA hydratase/isomerase family protein [Ceratobasidium sp. AG-Ba]|nr:enoyl-CoA hydratase/isomerase family protein [Ceratobasidium sp. AG-Ba]